MSGEEAVGGHAVAPVVGLKPNTVSLMKLQHCASGAGDVAILEGGQRAQHHLAIAPQVNVAHSLVQGTEELKLVNPRHHTGEISCPAVIVVLPVVEDLPEDDDLVGVGVTVA